LKKQYTYLIAAHKMRLVILLFLLFSCTAFSQNAKLDSLKQLLLTTKEDTLRSNILIEITRVFLYDFNDPDSMEVYTRKNLLLCQKINYKKGLAYSTNFMGIIRWRKGDLDGAMNYYDMALALMKEIRDLQGESTCLTNIAYVYFERSDYAIAEEYTKRALKIKEIIHDTRGLSISYNNLGNIYLNQSNYKQAILSYFKSLKLGEELNDTSGIAGCYINIATVLEAQNKKDDALKNYKNALVVASSVGDKYIIGYALNNIGNLYTEKKNYEGALDNYLRALRIRKETGDKQGQAETYNSLGSFYMSQKKFREAQGCQIQSLHLYEELGSKRGCALNYISIGKINEAMKKYQLAIDYYKKALLISTEINSRDVMRDSYQYLASVYERLNDPENSFKYLNLYYIEKDSLLNKENFKQIYEINTRYQTEKKEKEIELLTKDQIINEKTLKQQKIMRIALVVGLILVGILLFSLYARYRYKQKANLLLQQQKMEIQEKNLLITDSIDYAKTIQEAILPSESRLKNFFLQSFIFYKPKDIVSGDFYWVGQKGEKIICVAADCTGHGVPGAFMSLLGFNMLENIIENVQEQPAMILNALNTEMVSAMTQEQFNASSVRHGMDASIISIDLKNNILEYAGAHNSLYYIRNHQLTEIKADKQSIGTFKEGKEITFQNHSVAIEKGDVFYLFSDGFPDQLGGPNKKKFYYPPFKELLVSIHQLDADEQKAILERTITEWKGERDQTDDILVIGIKV
jgi:serine phosphatase RsbU (regulator of sigma subunit)